MTPIPISNVQFIIFQLISIDLLKLVKYIFDVNTIQFRKLFIILKWKYILCLYAEQVTNNYYKHNVIL